MDSAIRTSGHGGEPETSRDGRQGVPIGRVQPVAAEVEGQTEGVPVGMRPASGPPLGFEHDEADPERGQAPGGGKAGGSCSDDDDLGIEHVRRDSMICGGCRITWYGP